MLVTWAVCAGISHPAVNSWQLHSESLALICIFFSLFIFLFYSLKYTGIYYLLLNPFEIYYYFQIFGEGKSWDRKGGHVCFLRRPSQGEIVSWVLFRRGLILQVSPDSAELVSGEGWCLLWVQLVVLNYRAASLLRRKSSLRISVSRNC